MQCRLHVREVELGHLPDRLEDRVELACEPIELLLGQREARQPRHVHNLVS